MFTALLLLSVPALPVAILPLSAPISTPAIIPLKIITSLSTVVAISLVVALGERQAYREAGGAARQREGEKYATH